MSKEQFKKKWIGTHTELAITDTLEKGRHSGLKFPSDKNITTGGKIPGKNVIEAKCKEKRNEQIQDYMMDAVKVRSKEILDKKDMPFKELMRLLVNSRKDKPVKYCAPSIDVMLRDVALSVPSNPFISAIDISSVILYPILKYPKNSGEYATSIFL